MKVAYLQSFMLAAIHTFIFLYSFLCSFMLGVNFIDSFLLVSCYIPNIKLHICIYEGTAALDGVASL
eukprot:UN00765